MQGEVFKKHGPLLAVHTLRLKVQLPVLAVQEPRSTAHAEILLEHAPPFPTHKPKSGIQAERSAIHVTSSKQAPLGVVEELVRPVYVLPK